MKIERKRYVVMRNNRTEIWAGNSKHYRFRKLDDIKIVNIVSYHSKAKALASCSSYDRNFEIVPIIETISTIHEANNLLSKIEQGVQINMADLCNDNTGLKSIG